MEPHALASAVHASTSDRNEDTISHGQQQNFETLVASLQDALRRDTHTRRRDDLLRSDTTLTQVLIEVRHYVNALSPIAKLPSEILVDIFQDVVRLSGRSSCGGGTLQLYARANRRISTVLTLSYVCARWRTIALDAPSLWTRIDYGNEAQLDAFVTRSRSMPLSLFIPASQDIDGAKQFFEDLGHRISRLDIKISTPANATVPIDTCPSTPLASFHARLPLLECLTISTDRRFFRGLERDLPQALLFGTRLSPLKALGLHGHVWEKFPVNHFPYLTHLYLAKAQQRIESCAYYVYDLMDLLSKTPVLKFLHISGIGEYNSRRAGPLPRPVVLESLQALACVDGQLAGAFLLLSLLNMPETAVVRLDNLRSPFNPDHVRPGPNRVASERLFSSFKHLQLWTSFAHLLVVAEGPHSGLWIRATTSRYFHMRDTIYQWSEWIARLHEILPLATIQTLQLSCLDKSTLPTLLAHMPSLTQLSVLANPSPYARRVLKALYIALSRDGERLCCPALESITISATADDLCVSDALKMVMARSHMGIPLTRITLQTLPPHKPENQEPVAPVAMGPDSESKHDTFSPGSLASFREHVRLVEVVEDEEPVVCAFKMSEMWQVDAFEDYWEVPEDEKPRYFLPAD